MRKIERSLLTFLLLFLTFLPLLWTPLIVAQEREVIIYTVTVADLVDLAAKMFQNKTGIKVTWIHLGSTGTMFGRIEAEKDNPQADVAIGGPYITYIANKHLFMPYESPSEVNFTITDPEHIWHPINILPQILAVNPKALNESGLPLPRSIKDLLNPVYKGMVGLPDPSLSSTGRFWLYGMLTLYGWDFIKELLKIVKIYPGSDPAFAALQAGEIAIAFANEDVGYWEGLMPVYPEEGSTIMVDACGIIKGAPHLEEARKFLDFFLSKEFHTIMVEKFGTVLFRRSARKDVPPPSGLPEMPKPILFDPNFELVNKTQILETFKSLLP